MKKTFVGILIFVVMLGMTQTPKANAQTLTQRDRIISQVQLTIGSLAVSLESLRNSWVREQQELAGYARRLNATGTSIQTISTSDMQTEAGRNRIALILAESSQTVNLIGLRVNAIKTIRTSELVILSQLTEKFKALVSTIPRIAQI